MSIEDVVNGMVDGLYAVRSFMGRAEDAEAVDGGEFFLVGERVVAEDG